MHSKLKTPPYPLSLSYYILMGILERDMDIRLPEVRVVRASAGSGKTWALTLRFVQLLLSDRIRNNRPVNIIALTFSNNAAREMKERIFQWLKVAVLNPSSREAEILSEVISVPDREKLKKKAEQMLQELLENYSELQVMTIDSFLATLFKASSVELGVPPDFDIELDREELFRYSFDLFIRDLLEDEHKRRLLEDTIDRILKNQRDNSAYLWNPAERLVKEFIELHGKITSQSGNYLIQYRDTEIDALMESCKNTLEEMFKIIRTEGFEEYRNSNLQRIKSALDEKRYPDLLNLSYGRLTVKKPRKPTASFDRLNELWERVKEAVGQYALHYMQTYYSPYLETYQSFIMTLDETKRLLGKMLIEDISFMLSRYLRDEIVPDVFMRYGERVSHFLIDEFQDTSPLQWQNLSPLIENSLSEGGSLFVVGDTKQAIYGFRNADYRIMKSVEQKNPFPSATHRVITLNENHRSSAEILEYVEEVFKNRLPATGYHVAACLSGLCDYLQSPAKTEKGYVEVVEIEEDDQSEPERQALLKRIEDLKNRGYRNRDIAVLTMENYDVVKISSWLSEAGIPFLSYSSLDIRRRKITSEIISLLQFLDSPTNDFAFSEFLLGEVFKRALKSGQFEDVNIRRFLFETRGESNRYLLFREAYKEVWKSLFERLFKLTGYMPLYDLIIEALRGFDVIKNFPEEEATIVRLLEVVKEFEKGKGSDIQGFLSEFNSSSDREIWNITVPEGTDAVKVMTVHKSKGLGFEAVILVLYERWKPKGFPYIIEEQKEGVRILKVNKNLLSLNPFYQPLYEEEFYRRQSDELNALYVSLTRAKRELYILCVKKEGKRGYPFDILPCPYKSSEERPSITSKASEETVKRLFHPHSSPEVYHTEERDIDLSARKRGEFLHAVLSSVKYPEDLKTLELKNRINGYIRKFMVDTTMDDTLREVTEFINTPSIRPFFEKRPQREVLTEQEMVDRRGNLLRVDRMIVDADSITIVDFKTGSEMDEKKTESYLSQITRYVSVAREIYKNKPVRGVIVSFDRREIIFQTQ